ncbi:ATP-grasp domain-containing protein [Butyrivibrio sp. INlla18]|uniref:ATP-grasp domain-containing protein n=1 Tax=Butyrivibrio sp. INlla18 TaxID=1520806 RepID=UPI00088E40BD|nr:ATP-grasp domain-containing protein [Butyrivibrio sp. INlla18]SDA79137.1 ATP-grasp domain-containing protein [Butyrivibrio sp. INlla18]
MCSNKINMNLNILVTGAGSTMGQSVLKALLMSKYGKSVNIHVTNSEQLGAGYFISDRIVGRHIVPVAKDTSYIDAIINICKENSIAGIFSGTEHEIYALSNAAKRIKEESGAIVFLSRPEIVDLGTDKYKTYLAFKKYDLPFPETVLFDDYKKLLDITGGYPIFMKPRISSASRNIYKINSEEELFAKKFADSENIVLQEFLDSDIEYTAEAFCDKEGNVAGVIPMIRNLEYGMSYYGKIDDNSEVINVTRKVAAALKPEGAINVQMRIVNGRAIPFEINTRFSSTECVRAHYGFNSVEAAIDNYLFDLPVDLNNWKKGMFMRYWEECYFEENDIPGGHFDINTVL